MQRCLMMCRMQTVSGCCSDITQLLDSEVFGMTKIGDLAEMLGVANFCSIYCCNLSRRSLGNLCTLFQVDRIINPAATNGLFQAACCFIITFCTSVMDKLRILVVCTSG